MRAFCRSLSNVGQAYLFRDGPSMCHTPHGDSAHFTIWYPFSTLFFQKFSPTQWARSDKPAENYLECLMLKST